MTEFQVWIVLGLICFGFVIFASVFAALLGLMHGDRKDLRSGLSAVRVEGVRTREDLFTAMNHLHSSVTQEMAGIRDDVYQELSGFRDESHQSLSSIQVSVAHIDERLRRVEEFAGLRPPERSSAFTTERARRPSHPREQIESRRDA